MYGIHKSVAFSEKVLDIIEKNHRSRMTDMMNILESGWQFPRMLGLALTGSELHQSEKTMHEVFLNKVTHDDGVT